MRGVSLDNELLALLSVGIPVGIGVYWAWLHRDWPSETKTVGAAAAVGGGLVGAGFGFGASSGLLAPITAIVGGVAVANLALILFDMWRSRGVHDRLAVTTTTELLELKESGAVPAAVGHH
jgi:hypothetical protein